MTPAPYWTSPDGNIVVYCARFEDVLAAGLVPVREVALVHDDPPYGVNEQTKRASKRRVGGPGLHGGGVKCRDFPAIVGDREPFDPTPLLALQRPTVLWGANHYAPRVPASPSWLFWDKREGGTPDDNADGELAWTNLGGPLRQFAHLWRGVCRASEVGAPLGPCQKPIALSAYVFGRAKLRRGDLVFVPHGGSGPDLPACVAMSLRLIWCDVERWCCDTAISRIGAMTAARAAEPAGPLFCAHGNAGAPQIAAE